MSFEAVSQAQPQHTLKAGAPSSALLVSKGQARDHLTPLRNTQQALTDKGLVPGDFVIESKSAGIPERETANQGKAVEK